MNFGERFAKRSLKFHTKRFHTSFYEKHRLAIWLPSSASPIQHFPSPPFPHMFRFINRSLRREHGRHLGKSSFGFKEKSCWKRLMGTFGSPFALISFFKFIRR